MSIYSSNTFLFYFLFSKIVQCLLAFQPYTSTNFGTWFHSIMSSNQVMFKFIYPFHAYLITKFASYILLSGASITYFHTKYFLETFDSKRLIEKKNQLHKEFSINYIIVLEHKRIKFQL